MGAIRSLLDGDATVNEETRTVELTWSTGFKGLRRGWDGDFYEELSMRNDHVDLSRLNTGAPLLNSHDSSNIDSVIGVVERAWLEGDKGKAIVRFSADPSADKVFQKVKEKVLRNVSVGYQVRKYEDVSQRGDTVPTYRATNWQPHEISIVPIGFDPQAQVRGQDAQTEVEIELQEQDQPAPVPPVEETRSEPITITEEATPTSITTNKENVIMDPKQMEKQRRAEILSAVRAAKLEDAYAIELIDADIEADEARKRILEKLAAAEPAPIKSTTRVETGEDNHQKRVKGLEDALLNAVDSKHFQVTEEAREFKGKSLIRGLELVVPRYSLESDIAYANRAMTTSDLPNILANVAEKSMRQEFQIQQPTFTPWTKFGKLRNYKTANRLMLGDYPSLEKVNEHGEFKAGAVGESKESIKIDRYGKTLTMTKEMIVNDDLGALSDFSTKSARAASRLESSLVYSSTLIANPAMGDGQNLFSSAHNNLAASGTDITVAAVGAGWQAMAQQMTVDGLDYLDLVPKFLICGPAKATVAKQFVSQNMLANSLSSINPFAGNLTVIVDARITDNSWYLSADPGQIDTIELARLEGEDGPLVMVKEGQAPGSIMIVCEHSAGAAALDYRGLYKNAGT